MYVGLLNGVVSPEHLRKGQRVTNEDADELVPAVHPAALVQAPFAWTHHSAVDSEHHSPVYFVVHRVLVYFDERDMICKKKSCPLWVLFWCVNVFG